MEASDDTGEEASDDTGDNEKFKIATFNIKVFGRTKAGKPEVMSALAEIVRKYDVVAIQELKDVSNSVPGLFLAEINKLEPKYAMLLSPRTGQQEDDQSSQEQYAFYYNTETVKPLDSGLLYDDSERDYFQREPWLAHFQAVDGAFTFVLMNIHTRPEAAVDEIAALAHVMKWAQEKYPDEDDLIAIGDFNAGCSYASPEQLDAMVLSSSSYNWIIPHTADTNLSTSKSCAYDRIVTTIGTSEDFTDNWDVDEAFSNESISDHFPVWAEFFVNKDTQQSLAQLPTP